MEIMIENIRVEFKSMLDENEWMDKESKNKAREKVQYPFRSFKTITYHLKYE